MNKTMALLLFFIAIVAEEFVRNGIFTLFQGLYLFVLFLVIALVLYFVSRKMAPSSWVWICSQLENQSGQEHLGTGGNLE